MKEHAALVNGEPIARTRIDTFLATNLLGGAGLHQFAAPPRGATSHNEPAAANRHHEAPSAARQRRRWATQVIVTDELARRACADRGLEPPAEAPAMPLTVPEADVADLGSIVAASLAHSPAARLLLSTLEAEQVVDETAVQDYYTRNPDRFLTPEALRRGVDPFTGTTHTDFLPYEAARQGIARELRQAAGRQAFFDWLDHARTGVEYAVGHEHPGDPTHPDHEHRH